MRTEKKIFFGLTFPADFPLDEKSRHQLAKILLLNPRISVQKAKDILNNKVLWQKIKLLTDNLHCEISDISLLDSETETKEKDSEEQFISYLLELLYELFQVASHDRDFAFKNFRHKLFSWIIEFSFPQSHEIKIIAAEIKVERCIVSKGIYDMIFDIHMQADKIFDYISKYYESLSIIQIDELLDLYSAKTCSENHQPNDASEGEPSSVTRKLSQNK